MTDQKLLRISSAQARAFPAGVLRSLPLAGYRKWCSALLMVYGAFMASSASAAPVTVINPGFEDTTGATLFNEFAFGPLPGWDLYDPADITDGGAGNSFFIGTLTPFEPDPVGDPGVFVNFPDGAAEGARVGIAFNFNNVGGTGEYGFQQILSDVLQANTEYVLQVEIGNIASGTAMNNTFFDLDGFPGYRVDVLAGETLVASDDNSLAGSIPEGTFATSTVSFTTGANPAGAGELLAIRLVNLNEFDPIDPGADLEVDFDNVRFSATAVPGPFSLGLMSLGFAALIATRRRKVRIA